MNVYLINTSELEDAVKGSPKTEREPDLKLLWTSRIIPNIRDLSVVHRISRYHRGVRSPADFSPHLHFDTRCFAMGSLAFHYACRKLNSDFIVLRDKDEGRPHAWKVGETGGTPLKTTEKVDLLRLLSSQNDMRYEGGAREDVLLAPISTNFPLFNVSLSHQGPLVALCSCTHRAVGIDVMTLETVPPLCPEGQMISNYPTRDDFQRVAHRHHQATDAEIAHFFSDFCSYFTKDEWAYINGANAVTSTFSKAFLRLKRFYVLWCLKESYIKAIGIGLGLELQRASFQVLEATHPTQNQSEPPAAYPVLHTPSAISLRLDGVLLKEWAFWVYDVPAFNAVVAVAEGPFEDAAAVSTWGKGVWKAAQGLPEIDSASCHRPPSLELLPCASLF